MLSTENDDIDTSEEEYLSYSLEGNLLLPNVKKIFLPEPGYELMDADLSGADARVVAWDSGCRFLLDFFQREEGKLYAYIASHHLQREITAKSPEYHSYKTICHGCLIGEHEVLTIRGWITIKEYIDSGHLEKIFIWNSERGCREELYMDYPLDVYKGHTDILYKVTGMDGHDIVYQQIVTGEHKFYAVVNGKSRTVMAKDLAMGMSLPYLTQQGHWQMVKLGHNAVQRMASPKTPIYCFTTSTGYFITRYKGHIMPTGNSNYGMGLDKLAKVLNIPLDSAKSLQRWYFTICPEIPKWHKRIQETIEKRGFIENIFGRKRWFIDKKDITRYNKAYAFIGQSTVADAMNIAWVNVDKLRLSYQTELLTLVMMQVHDSLVTQYPIDIAEEVRPRILKAMEVEIPYKSPLVIPVDYKVSRVSYGDA